MLSEGPGLKLFPQAPPHLQAGYMKQTGKMTVEEYRREWIYQFSAAKATLESQMFVCSSVHKS